LSRNVLLVIAGACGAVFVALLILQLVYPEAPLFPVALPFAIAGCVISVALVLTDRRR
jgi:hypothetical protein